jgi:hypothetical protein
VDPIAKQYPELTVYQFASNTPIMAVDLDGLERYFAADGRFLGKSGNSTEIRIIAKKETIKIAQKNLQYKKWNHNWLRDWSAVAYESKPRIDGSWKNDYSTTFSTEDKIYQEWAAENQPKINEVETGMMIFEKTLTDENGEKIDVLMSGSNATGKPKKYVDDNYTVDVFQSKLEITNIDLEKDYGWRRKSAIHTHPQISDTNFSNIKDVGIGGTEYSGDIPFALHHNMNIYLVTKASHWIKKFDVAKYRELNPKGLHYHLYWPDHVRFSDRATQENSIPFVPKRK